MSIMAVYLAAVANVDKAIMYATKAMPRQTMMTIQILFVLSEYSEMR